MELPVEPVVVLVVADAAAAVPALTDWTWLRATWLSPTSSIGPSVPNVTPVTLPGLGGALESWSS